MFQVGLPCYLGLNSGRSVSINVNKTRKRFPEKFMSRPCFLMFAVSHTGNIISSVSFCFQDANYACTTQQGTLTKIRACEHSSNFCEQFEHRPNFASTFKLDGTIRHPYLLISQYISLPSLCGGQRQVPAKH